MKVEEQEREEEPSHGAQTPSEFNLKPDMVCLSALWAHVFLTSSG